MLGGIGYGIAHSLLKAPKSQERLEQALFAPYFESTDGALGDIL